ncbi:cell division cycle protein 27 homolog B isoform X2 [Silene latifolia]|uniref:cell division cycle protein 27 homolog B isoform X2 n=1 Tax=Silene latifolia TaxID=37657 RepID=UPI003D76BC08
MEAILVDSVQNSLRHFMHHNAIFVCERLCAEFPTEENLQLLATSYLRNNQAYAAYHILKGTHMAQSRYLFALSCFQMDLLKEAEAALSPANDSNLEIPNGAAGHYLLGLIYRYTDRGKIAVHHFNQALSIDPLFWSAYEELCVLGCAEEAASIFGEVAAQTVQKQHILSSQTFVTSSEDINQVSFRSLEDRSPGQLKSANNSSVKDATGNYQGTGGPSVPINQSLNCASSSMSFYNTPSPMASQMSGIAPPPVCRNVQQNPASTSSENFPRSVISGRLFSDSGPRRSTRLAGEVGGGTNSTATTSTGNGTNHSTKHLGSSRLSSGGLRSVTVRKPQASAGESFDEGGRYEAFDDSRRSSRASISASSFCDTSSAEQDGGTMSISQNACDDTRVHRGAVDIMSLWRLLGEGYRLSSMYKCKDALEFYQKLPLKHYNTSWVLSQVGRANFGLMDYFEADRAFSLARRQCPYSLDGMDVYSSVLYLLKEDMKLSYLAKELLSTDRLAPQTWCAMGNCYSLQKDHDTALKNFQRAVQLNSRFAYAHTLCGHEHVALEDFDNGIRSFQNALSVDSRHHNAWYGLGMVYLRQEKFEFAEHQFRVASQINPRSSVIMSYLGTALHYLKRNEEALLMMEKAILADKKNPLPMYQKANILFSMDKYDAALEVLEELKEYAPRECSIYALMGKIYKRKNVYDKAMLHFGLALDLKPSAADVATIKAAIEKLHVPDDLDDFL